jgi:hypothetical protein
VIPQQRQHGDEKSKFPIFLHHRALHKLALVVKNSKPQQRKNLHSAKEKEKVKSFMQLPGSSTTTQKTHPSRLCLSLMRVSAMIRDW